MCQKMPICGIQGFMGCNKPIEHIIELYRCTDCGIAFHKSCILGHFNGAHNPHPLRETQLSEALGAKEQELIQLRSTIARIVRGVSE